MSSEFTHICDPYAYAVMQACASSDRTHGSLYISNTQRRKLDELVSAGWLVEQGKMLQVSPAGIEAMRAMELLLAGVGDDAWIGIIDAIDEVRAHKRDMMRSRMEMKRRKADI